MKKIFLILLITVGILWGFDVMADFVGPCTSDCLKKGTLAGGSVFQRSLGIFGAKSLSQSIQDLIKYFLSFLSLIAVIYIIYAGAQMLLNPASEESGEKTKKIITSVIIGIAIIWFAWWIVGTIFYVLNNKKVISDIHIPRAMAETQIRIVDFTTYRNKILALKTQISGPYSQDVTKQLSILVRGAYDQLPDREDFYINRQLYDALNRAIKEYDLHREEIDKGILENALEAFLEQTRVFSIQGQISAAPQSGDAPLSVTLEAKNMIDSSGTLIPDNNYIWWLRTSTGSKILGRGKTINYIFETEGTYTVNLTVNTASKNSKGFYDVISFEDQITVEAGQPKVNYVIFFNKELAGDSIKIFTRDATEKVIIDASQTRFASGYTITKTEWDFGNGVTEANDGPPTYKIVSYKEGGYILKLTLTRNDGEVFSKNVAIKVGDPVASIKISNKNPNKGEKVTFQAKNTSEDGVGYLWEIKKFGTENVIFSTSGPRMEYTFSEIGRYSVNLSSVKGQSKDTESVEIAIESRPPIVRFDIQQTNSETPNTYIFDGTATYDPDFPDNRNLVFSWTVNDTPIELSESNTSKSRGTYTFDEKGTYQVELRVSDANGKGQSYRKSITVKNLLSVSLGLRPQVVKRGERVLFLANAHDASIYEWTLGDADPVVTENGRYSHSFPTSGTFTINLKVTDREGESNSLQRKIYVISGDAPQAVPQLSTKSTIGQRVADACSGQEALVVDRVNAVVLSGDKSVNINGKAEELSYFWKIGLNTTSTQKTLNHTFDELGCEEISLTVTDKKTGVSHTVTDWVKVTNLPPKFSDIMVKIENIDQDPMKVNLQLLGAQDPDGVIRSYTWYYSTSTDDQPLGFRITTKPEASFSLQKINGRYLFSVVMEDSNGVKVDTRNATEVKFSTPDLLVSQNISTPIIDFSSETKEIKYGDPLNLTVKTRNALGQDISGAAEYRWDVDGDGFYDIKTTEPKLSYKLTVPGEYHPKVKVTHRGLSTTKSLTVSVINKLVPKVTLITIGDKIVAYNDSAGIIQSVSWFADDKKISENRNYLIYTPSEKDFPKNIKIQISDGKQQEEASFAVTKNTRNKIALSKIETPLVVLSNQSTGVSPVGEEIVWKDPETPLYIYLGESRGDIRYYIIDTDADIDTDLSGGRDDDADNIGTLSYKQGKPFLVPIGNKRETIMRISLKKDDKTEVTSRQIRIIREFIPAPQTGETDTTGTTPQAYNLSAEDKDRIDTLSDLVKNIPQAERTELQKYLDQLGDIWYDRADRAETLLQFSQSVNKSSNLTPELKSRIQEQINLIYTKGDEDAEAKIVARALIADFLSKSKGAKDIFGDGKIPGLINEIIDSPDAYEENKKIASKIYDEYVKFDTDISDEAKSLIEKNLSILIGTPSVAETPTTNPEATETPDSDTSIKDSITQFIGLIPGGLISIVSIFLGLLGLVFVWKKITNSGTDKSVDDGHYASNTLPDLPGGQRGGPAWLHDDQHPGMSGNSESHGDTGVNTPDWLKESPDQFSGVDVFSQAESPTSTSANTPVKNVEPTINPAKADNSHESNHDIPDWLSGGDSHGSMTTSTDIVHTSSSEKTEVTNTPLVTPDDTSKNTQTESSDIPDWLKGADMPSIETTPTDTSNSPSTGIESLQVLSTPETLPAVSTIDNGSVDNDIPDWLRGADTPVEVEAQIHPVSSETSTTTTDSYEAIITTPESSGTTGAPVDIVDNDIPDWLRGNDTAISATIQESAEIPIDTPKDEIIITPTESTAGEGKRLVDEKIPSLQQEKKTAKSQNNQKKNPDENSNSGKGKNTDNAQQKNQNKKNPGKNKKHTPPQNKDQKKNNNLIENPGHLLGENKKLLSEPSHLISQNTNQQNPPTTPQGDEKTLSTSPL